MGLEMYPPRNQQGQKRDENNNPTNAKSQDVIICDDTMSISSTGSDEIMVIGSFPGKPATDQDPNKSIDLPTEPSDDENAMDRGPATSSNATEHGPATSSKATEHGLATDRSDNVIPPGRMPDFDDNSFLFAHLEPCNPALIAHAKTVRVVLQRVRLPETEENVE